MKATPTSPPPSEARLAGPGAPTQGEHRPGDGLGGPRSADQWTPEKVVDVQDAVRTAAGMRIPLRIVGRGTWLDAGHPTVSDTRPLRLDALTGIVAYAPGDLTLTAHAGTSLAAIAAAAGANAQWLTADPFATDPERGSIGALVATASAGPLAGSLGGVRDLVLGLEVVTGDGVLIRTGGRVVKNVAGFDVTRLMTGAWGTLGVITEVTVRLRGAPPVDETFVLSLRRRERSVDTDRAAVPVDALASALRMAPVEALAAEIINPALAMRLGFAAPGPIALVRIAGNAERVAAQRAALSALGEIAAVPTSIWTTLRTVEPAMMEPVAVVRWAHLPSQLGQTWQHVISRCAGFDGLLLHASVARGVVRAIIPASDPALVAAAIGVDIGRASPPVHGGRGARIESVDDAGLDAGSGRTFAGGSVIPERLPVALWRAAAMRSRGEARVDRLTARIRTAFDPYAILNRGLLGDGVHG